MLDSPMLIIAGLALGCGICQWLSWRFKLPSILFLLTTGILVGPVFQQFDPDSFFGDLLFPFVSVAVAIILFEGGLTLKLKDIRGHGTVVTRLISLGVLITWGLLATAVHFIFGMDWPLALVFGSITVVSGPTVIKPLLRTVRPTARVGHLLNWEGILIDPIGVFLALLVFEFVALAQPGAGHIAWILTKLIVVGTVFGITAGYATARVLQRYLVPDYLVNVLTLVTVIFVFVIAETLQHESGLLAVTIMGVWLANTKGLHIDEILNFKEDLSVLLISTLFIVLAARLDLSLIPQYGWQILLLLIVVQFVIRPINVALCTYPSELNMKERVFLGWIAPRGIVAAAISSLFVLRLEEMNIAQTDLLVPLTFSLIIGTVVFQSLTAKPLADKLGIRNPEPNGVLFFGANEVALTLAESLRKEEIDVRMADTSWRNVRQARAAGYQTYHGNPTSGHAAENLDLQGIGKLIALSENRDTNALAGMHFRREFGASSVFTLEGVSDDDVYDRFDIANRYRGNPLFDVTLNFTRLLKALKDGEVRHVILVGDESGVMSNAGDAGAAELDAETSAGAAGQTTVEEPRPASGLPTDGSISTDESLERRSSKAEQRTLDATEAASDQEADAAQPLIGKDDLCLFAIDTAGMLYIYGAGESFTPKAGWRVVVLTPPRESSERKQASSSAS